MDLYDLLLGVRAGRTSTSYAMEQLNEWKNKKNNIDSHIIEADDKPDFMYIFIKFNIPRHITIPSLIDNKGNIKTNSVMLPVMIKDEYLYVYIRSGEKIMARYHIQTGEIDIHYTNERLKDLSWNEIWRKN